MFTDNDLRHYREFVEEHYRVKSLVRERVLMNEPRVGEKAKP
jgi:hypothetical protein